MSLPKGNPPEILANMALKKVSGVDVYTHELSFAAFGPQNGMSLDDLKKYMRDLIEDAHAHFPKDAGKIDYSIAYALSTAILHHQLDLAKWLHSEFKADPFRDTDPFRKDITNGAVLLYSDRNLRCSTIDHDYMDVAAWLLLVAANRIDDGDAAFGENIRSSISKILDFAHAQDRLLPKTKTLLETAQINFTSASRPSKKRPDAPFPDV